MQIIGLVKDYFTKTGRVYPTYHNALLFLITEAIEALENPFEMGDVLMMYSIAVDQSNTVPERLLAQKIERKLAESNGKGAVFNEDASPDLGEMDLHILKKIGEAIDAIVNSKAAWVRNNEKDRNLPTKIDELIDALIAYHAKITA